MLYLRLNKEIKNMGRFKKGSKEAKEFMASIKKKKVKENTPPEQVKAEDIGVQSPVSERDRLIAEEKRLALELQEGMPSKHDWVNTVPGVLKRHNEWQARNLDKIHEWQAVRRQLYPDDTKAGNVEVLRG